MDKQSAVHQSFLTQPQLTGLGRLGTQTKDPAQTSMEMAQHKDPKCMNLQQICQPNAQIHCKFTRKYPRQDTVTAVNLAQTNLQQTHQPKAQIHHKQNKRNRQEKLCIATAQKIFRTYEKYQKFHSLQWGESVDPKRSTLPLTNHEQCLLLFKKIDARRP